MEFNKVSRVLVVDAIVDVIARQIIERELVPGNRIPSEQDLAEKMNVGRSSVREALKALEIMGVLTRNNEGTFVADPDDDFLGKPLSYLMALKDISFNELYQLRCALEVTIAEMAAEKADQQDLDLLKSLVEKDKSNSIEEKVKSNVSFHLCLAKASKNKIFYEIIKSLKMILTQSQFTTIQRENSYLEHEEIYKAVVTKDPQKARLAMKTHLSGVYEHVIP